MATPATPLPISENSQQAVIQYLSSAIDLFATSYNIRSQMELRDRAYYRTNDYSDANLRAKAANNAGDPAKIQNITVPVVMPQVETALSELQDIFLTGYPIFATVAPPDQMDMARQMDAIIEDNSTRGMWANELLLTMRDGLKYDLGAVEVVWENRKIFAVTTPEAQSMNQGTPTETYYAGNFIKHLDAYNLILDTRVSPEKNHSHGEFAGYTDLISRIQLKKEMEDLPPLGTMNFRKAFESPGPGAAPNTDIQAPYYEPSINPDALLPVENRRDHNWLAWANLAEPDRGGGINYSNVYERTVLYARILPSDFKIPGPNKNHVQIWKFIIINRHVVIYAERQTNAHNLLPIICCKPSNDGRNWQSKSFAENVMPTQSIATSLVNSALESQRRKVYDRLFYDPSRVNKKDIDVVSSVARIPVKNSAYGKGLAEAVYQVPYRDDGVSEILQISQQITQMGDIANGQNRVQQGQFQKGNKTRKEFDTVMSGANSRGRMRALGLEMTFFMPIKEVLKSNILQYQQPATIVSPANGTATQIDPQALRQAQLRFKLADGFTPAEKMMGTDLFGTIFAAAQAMPMIDVEYDIMGMFIYSMQLQGGGWMQDFKRDEAGKAARMQEMAQASLAAGQRNPPPEKPPEGAPA